MIFKRIVPDEYYLFKIIFKRRVQTWGLVIIAMTEEDVTILTNVNSGLNFEAICDSSAGIYISTLIMQTQILYDHGQHFNAILFSFL